MKAFHHVKGLFVGLSLHNRLALLVPDETFRQLLRRSLQPYFDSQGLEAVTAEQASCQLPGTESGQDSGRQKEWIVIDTIDNFAGLERLIIMAIGLDLAIQDDASLEGRSRLYRAITRAYMLAILVNENVNDGWLAWLNNVEHEASEQLDRDQELGQHKKDAVQNVVKRLGSRETSVTKHRQTAADSHSSEDGFHSFCLPQTIKSSSFDTSGISTQIVMNMGACSFMPMQHLQ
jgi:hypothetical protein